MNQTNQCPKCGTELTDDAPQGLCPKCLMANALETESMRPHDMSTLASPEERNATVKIDDINVEAVGAIEESPGRYSILGEYGKGGMGRVLLVHDEHLSRDIALKELLPGLGNDSTPALAEHAKEMTARFLREAKITGQLEHPSITPVHELGRREDGTLYYTMKLIRGKTLSQAIEDAGSLEKRLALLPHFVDLCNAIAYAHSRGVIHRDIKPSNVMIGDFGETVVIDWGLAKVKGRKETSESDPMADTILSMKTGKEDDSAKTQYGRAMGTPAYMPPEQATGDLDLIDERSDVYSLGAVLYQILTGQPPYKGDSAQDILRKVVTQDPVPVNEIQNGVSRELLRIWEQSMNKDPEKRIPTPFELARRVDRSTQERVYLNPLRPYLNDLVPELKTLDEKQKRHVIYEAGRRRGRNMQVMARLIILAIPTIIYSISSLSFLLLSIPLDTLVKDYRTMDTRIATLNSIIRSQSEPGTYPEAFFEPESRASDTLAETYHGKAGYIMRLVLGTTFLLLFGYIALTISLVHAGRASLAPYIREVLTELETRGHIGISESAGKRLYAQQGFTLVAGLLLGGAAGFLLHQYLGFGHTAQTLITLGGSGMGLLISGACYFLYAVSPSRSDIE